MDIYEEDSIVGHVLFTLPSQFLARDVYKEVTGEKVNGGAGYGLEIPCTYHVYRPKTYVIN